MNSNRTALIILSSGFIALIWRYAWANFISLVVFHHVFPLPEAILIFGLSFLICYVSFGKGWRIIQVIGLQLLGFTFAFAREIYVFHEWSYSFLDPGWINEFLTANRGAVDWLILVLILFWVILFWTGGWTLAKKPRRYIDVCARFDTGISFLFLLFLAKFIISIKGGTVPDDPLSIHLIVPFFLFSLLAITMAREQSQGSMYFLTGNRGLSVVLSFSIVVFLFSAGILYFFWAYLTLAAETSYSLIKMASAPFGPILVSVLRFLFASRKIREDPYASETGKDRGADLSNIDMSSEPMSETMWLILTGLVILVFLIAGSVLLWFFIKWLFTRTEKSQKTPYRWGIWKLLFSILDGLKYILLSIKNLKKYIRSKPVGAIELFAGILIWGKRSGLPRRRSETPIEYGTRLSYRFPTLKEEIDRIITLFNLYLYGGSMGDRQNLVMAKRALNRLRSPVYWGLRLKTLLLYSESVR